MKRSYIGEKALSALSKIIYKAMGVMQEDIDMLKKVKLTNVIPGEYAYFTKLTPDLVMKSPSVNYIQNKSILNYLTDISTNLLDDRIVEENGEKYVLLKAGKIYKVETSICIECLNSVYHSYFIVDNEGKLYSNIAASGVNANVDRNEDISSICTAIIKPDKDILIKSIVIIDYPNVDFHTSIPIKVYNEFSYFLVQQIGVNLEYFNLYGATQDLSCNNPKMLVQAPAVKQLTDQWKKYLNAEYADFTFTKEIPKDGFSLTSIICSINNKESILNYFDNTLTNLSSDRFVEYNGDKYVLLKKGITYKVEASIAVICDGNYGHYYYITDKDGNIYGNIGWTYKSSYSASSPSISDYDMSSGCSAIIAPKEDLLITCISNTNNQSDNLSTNIRKNFCGFSIHQISVNLDMI